MFDIYESKKLIYYFAKSSISYAISKLNYVESQLISQNNNIINDRINMFIKILNSDNYECFKEHMINII